MKTIRNFTFALAFLTILLTLNNADAIAIKDITPNQDLIVKVTDVSAGTCKDAFLCGDPDFGLKFTIQIAYGPFLFAQSVDFEDFEVASIKTGTESKVDKEFLISGQKIQDAVLEAMKGMIDRSKEVLNSIPDQSDFRTYFVIFFEERGFLEADSTTLCKTSLTDLDYAPMHIVVGDSVLLDERTIFIGRHKRTDASMNLSLALQDNNN
jgi:hypothetical protein